MIARAGLSCRGAPHDSPPSVPQRPARRGRGAGAFDEPPKRLQVVVLCEDGRAEVALRGELDLEGIPALIAALTPLLCVEGLRVVVDAAELTVFDEAGVDCLARIRHRLEACGGELMLRSASSRVRRTLRRAGLSDVLRADRPLPTSSAEAGTRAGAAIALSLGCVVAGSGAVLELPPPRVGRSRVGASRSEGGKTSMSATEGAERLEEMFVQLALGSRLSGDRLTLTGMSSSTLYFSDRPERVVGHLTPEQFVEIWFEDRDDGFAADPPNAVFSYRSRSGHDPGGLDDAVLALRDVELGEDSITYDVDILSGTIPPSTAECSLFIDPLVSPLPPLSVLGARRLDGRRERRRL